MYVYCIIYDIPVRESFRTNSNRTIYIITIARPFVHIYIVWVHITRRLYNIYYIVTSPLLYTLYASGISTRLNGRVVPAKFFSILTRPRRHIAGLQLLCIYI